MIGFDLELGATIFVNHRGSNKSVDREQSGHWKLDTGLRIVDSGGKAKATGQGKGEVDKREKAARFNNRSAATVASTLTMKKPATAGLNWDWI